MLIYKEQSPTKVKITLAKAEAEAIYYHDIFDYPLSYAELIKWAAVENSDKLLTDFAIESKNGFFFKKGRSELIYKRLIRNRISKRKMEIAKEAAQILAYIKFVKMIAVTGSLAMGNASEESDIDLMLVTTKNTLWITRPLAYLLLKVFGLAIRKPNQKNEKDKLCLNIWLDENNFSWTQKNQYTAHEIAQVVPLYSTDNTYERFLTCNTWLKNYWPNAVRTHKKLKQRVKATNWGTEVVKKLNVFLFNLQLKYMGKKISTEVVTSGKALFHPVDWSEHVLNRL